MDVWCVPDRKTEMRMIRWMCGVSLKERQPSTELRRRRGVEAMRDMMRRGRLMWHGQNDADYVQAGWWLRGWRLPVGRGRPGVTLRLQTCV